jgi:hypothetical protein
MLINRNNYEDFFLLYADGELRADERKAVEDFVAENQDLSIELEMLIAAVLPLEEIVFIDKSFLYKEPIFDIGIQEKLLLKLDNELDGEELNSINSELATNETTKKEFDLLKRTKLDTAEKIVFEEKHLLYKKEKDNVVPFRFMRWAAAAILIGFGLFFGIKTTLNKNTETIGIAKSKTQTNKNAEKESAEKNINNIATTIENESTNTTKTIINKNIDDNKVEERIAVQKKEENNNTKPASTIKEKIEENKKPVQNQEETLVNNKSNFLPEQELIVNKKEATNVTIAKTPENIKKLLENENVVALEDTYKQAIAINENEKSGDKILYIDEDVVKRSKAGGFFRKIKRMVERTANIKPGNSIQIAGFEIAAK